MHVKGIGLVGLMMVGTGAQAAGFALIEQSASGLGNAYAGQAASAQDASTIFFNPAGLTRVQGRQVVVAGNAIGFSAEFADGGSARAPLQTSLGGDGGQAGGWSLAPNFYYAMDVRPGLKFGLGVNAPFGLVTEYNGDWAGRFHAVKSDLKTLNVNPSLAFKLDGRWSLGAGINAQQARAVLTNKVNYSAVLFQATSGAMVAPNLEGTAKVEGDDWSWGYNLGLLFSPDEATRIGLNYRSRQAYTLEGSVSFSRPAGLTATQAAILNAAVPNGGVTASVKLPDSASLSLMRQVSPQWDLLADITWTHWGLFDDLTIVRSNGATLGSTPENWNNVWRYSAGLNYHPGGDMMWRFGLAYDETPVPDAYRTPRIPDESRTWLAAGGQYHLSKQAAVDFGYAHLFVKDASINQASASGGVLAGRYDNAVDIVSVQYTHSF